MLDIISLASPHLMYLFSLFLHFQANPCGPTHRFCRKWQKYEPGQTFQVGGYSNLYMLLPPTEMSGPWSHPINDYSMHDLYLHHFSWPRPWVLSLYSKLMRYGGFLTCCCSCAHYRPPKWSRAGATTAVWTFGALVWLCLSASLDEDHFFMEAHQTT